MLASGLLDYYEEESMNIGTRKEIRDYWRRVRSSPSPLPPPSLPGCGIKTTPSRKTKPEKFCAGCGKPLSEYDRDIGRTRHLDCV